MACLSPEILNAVKLQNLILATEIGRAARMKLFFEQEKVACAHPVVTQQSTELDLYKASNGTRQGASSKLAIQEILKVKTTRSIANLPHYH
jgi:hypothetical protein